jgi:hypothetical protein
VNSSFQEIVTVLASIKKIRPSTAYTNGYQIALANQDRESSYDTDNFLSAPVDLTSQIDQLRRPKTGCETPIREPVGKKP